MSVSITSVAMRHKVIDGILVVKPTRENIENLKIGDYAPHCFGAWGKVNSITFRGNDIHGKAYVGYYVQWHGEDSSISQSIKEDEIVATIPVTRKWNQAQLAPF